LIAIDTLQLLAKQIQIEENGMIIPMIDARRMEVFTARFYDKNHNQIRETQAEIIDETSYARNFRKIHLIGDGIRKILNTVLTNDQIYIFLDVLFSICKRNECRFRFKNSK
jgi:tRNA threonylcarbamoyladenosine biosynthesis protein TsaB